jgi:hypothetical protein
MDSPQIEMGGFKVNTPQLPNGGLGPTMPGSWNSRETIQRAIRSIRIVIFTSKLNLLLPFGPASIILHFTSKRHVSTAHRTTAVLSDWSVDGLNGCSVVRCFSDLCLISGNVISVSSREGILQSSFQLKCSVTCDSLVAK